MSPMDEPVILSANNSPWSPAPLSHHSLFVASLPSPSCVFFPSIVLSVKAGLTRGHAFNPCKSISFTNHRDVVSFQRNCWQDKAVQIVGDSTLKVSVVQWLALMGCLFFYQVPPQGYIITMELPATEHQVRPLQEMELVSNKDIIVTHNIKGGLFQFHVILTRPCFL